MLELIGRYVVQGRIGEGAMADVYRAYDPGIDRVLAIKVLKAEFCQNREYATRFLREAKAAGALSHPNIVTIYDVGEVDGYPYIAMELLEGEPLDKVAYRHGPLPAADVAAIALQLAEALSYAHAQGVVHRDIKPSNVMLSADGRATKILDFGIARVSEADNARHERESLRTQIGQVVGTPRYMSPEQALGQPIDGRSDLFSVGVVLYELLTGRKAFDGASAATLALQITQEDPRPIGELAPDTPRGLLFIVDKLLAKRPDRRFADGEQLAEALRRELKVLDAAAVESDGRSRRLSLQLRSALLMAAITAVVLLASVGVVLDRQYQAMQGMAVTSGSAIAAFVANNAALRAADNATLPPAQRDWAPVEAFVKAASDDPNLKQMLVVDAAGVIRAANDPRLVGTPYRRPAGEPTVRKAGDLTVTSTAFGKTSAFRFVRPITYAGRSFGQVDVSIGKAELDRVAGLSRLLMIGLALATLGVVAVVSYMAGRRVAAPIRRLSRALADAAGGDLDFRISHSRKDEFGELFDGFNRLAAAVQARLESTSQTPPGATAAKRRSFVARALANAPVPEAPAPSVAAPSKGLEQTLIAPPRRGIERLFNAARR